VAVLGTAGLVLVGAVVVTSAHDIRPMQTSEGAQVFTAQQFDEAVTFYRQVCPSLLGLRSAPDVYSRAVEDSIGKDTSTVDDALRAAVDGIAADAGTGAAALPPTAPQVPSVEQVRPVDYTPALDAARTVLTGQSRTLAAVTATSADGPDPAAERLRDAVGDAAAAASGVLDDLSTTAPLPNRKAVDAVAAAPECDGLFADSPVDPETVHRPQVDLYAAADRAHRRWEKTVDRYSEQDGTGGADHSGMVADLRDAAAEAATVLQRWVDDNPADPVTGDTAAARDAVSVYRGIAAKAADAADTADAAGTADADPQSWVDDEAKLQVRFPRSVPAVNRPTADALAERD
jgi:hypothetical protein